MTWRWMQLRLCLQVARLGRVFSTLHTGGWEKVMQWSSSDNVSAVHRRKDGGGGESAPAHFVFYVQISASASRGLF